ncbi:CrcB-like protein-domain-containing protein [Syncephalis fuscata]|nr:CrcB-like protein-domain-containing protein [Syncephalis fuscata]
MSQQQQQSSSCNPLVYTNSASIRSSENQSISSNKHLDQLAYESPANNSRSVSSNEAINRGNDNIIQSEDTSSVTAQTEQPTVFVSESLLSILAAITFFSILGTAARIGLIAMHTYPNVPVVPVAYAQGVGCLLMGAFIQLKPRLLYRSSTLYVGLTTGIGTLCVCLLVASGSFALGQTWGHMLSLHLWPKLTDKAGRAVVPQTERMHFFRFSDCKWIDGIFLVLGPLLFLAMVLSGIFFPDSRTYTVACAFGPFGSILRYFLSWLNFYNSQFPYGTFIANILGTLILAALFSVGHINLVLSTVSCMFIAALSDGFCGCLTTVSTFIVEIHSLLPIYAHRYAAITITLGILIMVAGPGTLYWTHGPLTPLCHLT